MFGTNYLIFLVLAGKSKTSDFVNITITTQQQNVTGTLPGETNIPNNIKLP